MDSTIYNRRESARIFVISPEFNVLLFRFSYKDGALAGSEYWATPGGKLELGESYEAAAIRELYEETGIRKSSVGRSIINKEFTWRMPDGEMVIAVEKYFIVFSENEDVYIEEWTRGKSCFCFDYKWWSLADLKNATVSIFPSDIFEILKLEFKNGNLK